MKKGVLCPYKFMLTKDIEIFFFLSKSLISLRNRVAIPTNRPINFALELDVSKTVLILTRTISIAHIYNILCNIILLYFNIFQRNSQSILLQINITFLKISYSLRNHNLSHSESFFLIDQTFIHLNITQNV